MANGLNTERIVQVHKTNTENAKKERKWREITIMTLQQTLLQKFCMKVRCGMQFLMWFFSIYFLLKWSFIACDAVFGGEKWSYAMHKKFLDAPVVERAPFPSHTGLVCTRQLMGTQFKFFYILFPQQFSFFAQECAYTWSTAAR